jgi:hypothetical protein
MEWIRQGERLQVLALFFVFDEACYNSRNVGMNPHIATLSLL